MSRPRIKPRVWAWKAKDKTETPGIALWTRNGLAGHLTYAEARTLADTLHDMADKHQGQAAAAQIPATKTEQE